MFGKKIIDLAKATRPNLHAQSISRPPTAITNFLPQKDKIQKDYQSNIVYTISCSESDDSHIGKANRPALRRYQKHGAPQQCKSPSIPQVVARTLSVQQLRRSDQNKDKPKINHFQKENIQEDETQSMSEEQLKKAALYKHQIEKNYKMNWNGWKIILKVYRCQNQQ